MNQHTRKRPGWRGLGLNLRESQFDLLTRILHARRWTKRAFVEDAIARQAHELELDTQPQKDTTDDR